MFGWRKPRCPVDAEAKRWIESRLRWLSGQFGQDTFTRRALILPTVEFFPDPMDGTEASVRNLLDQVCGYMDVHPDRVALELFTDHSEMLFVNDHGQHVPMGAAGLYEEQPDKTVIHINTAEMHDLSGLVATMAHELSHLRLLGENRVTGDEYDNELLTDLTAVFHGFGIFMGSSPRDWVADYSSWPGSTLKRPEYMSLPMFAYALAHTAWFRGQRKPHWYPFLSSGLRADFNQAIRYLMETGDSTFAPKHLK